MLSYYYTHRGKPGVRFFEGKEGLQEIYKDQLRTREYVRVVRTPADKEFGEILFNYLNKRAQLKIKSETFGPAFEEPMRFASENNERLLRTTSWFPPQSYTAPVEISIYGNKVSMISFGDEAVGTIIESPQIAQAMRELYEMAKVGAKTLLKEQV